MTYSGSKFKFNGSAYKTLSLFEGLPLPLGSVHTSLVDIVFPACVDISRVSGLNFFCNFS